MASLPPDRLRDLSDEVLAVYLFGSRAQGIENPLADYDYGILTRQKGHRRGDALYQKLYDILSEISPRTLANDVIDIVFLRDAGLELRFHVIRYGKILYDRDPGARLAFEVQTGLLYCDYRPLLDEFDRVILESL
ncbi:MAG TPA: hypothetical protein DF383_11900 [Deltaproteobacteria bacterium]|nr:hypothetical protein [Deltaproteobacteria bacterium]